MKTLAMRIAHAVFFTGILGLVASIGAAQAAVTVQAAPGKPMTASVSYRVPPPLFTVIAGAPYSAEQIQENWHTATDGDRVSPTPFRTKMWRDSAGRTRTEGPLVAMAGLHNSTAVIEIHDPVAGLWYLLDVETKVAHRAVLESRPEPPAPAAPTDASTGLPGTARSKQCSRDSLGTKTIEGVSAEGWLIQCADPASSEATVAEMWTAPDLKATVLRKVSHLRGESTVRLIHISRAEPDLSLFQPPAGYKVVDETAPFTVTRK